ncbi:MAG TPA: DUF2750 domain-containing protein [Gammaproteobacteria bacterium]|nr:DUF2750 domain-containing protein [Gammaproteobacteria bacterium]
MNDNPDQQELLRLRGLSADDRFRYLLEAAGEQDAVWILRDDEGFVMVSSDDEQCIPVWPHEACAAEWATGEWSECGPLAIDLDTWRQRWRPGLEGDGIQVAAFPAEQADVVVVSPAEFTQALTPG